MKKQKLSKSRIVSVELDTANLAISTPTVEQERRIAIHDLLQENAFQLVETNDREFFKGPYKLKLGIRDRRLVLTVNNQKNVLAREVHLSLIPLRQVIKDYFDICASYYDAVKRLAPSQIEAIDVGRRGIHDEGSKILIDRLADKIELDQLTSRRLFTLICVLHFKV